MGFLTFMKEQDVTEKTWALIIRHFTIICHQVCEKGHENLWNQFINPFKAEKLGTRALVRKRKGRVIKCTEKLNSMNKYCV